MTAAPSLQRVGQLPLYALSSYSEAGLERFWAGYRPGQAGFDPAGGLDAAWQDPGGAYLFLGQLPPDEAAFATFLAALDSVRPGLPNARILWIANPLDPPGNWQLGLVPARASGSGPGIAWKLSRSATLEVGQYGVTLAAGTPLAQAPPALGYGILAGGAGLGFETPRSTYAAAPGSTWLPLAGAAVGSWLARLPLPAAAGDGMRGLGVAQRFAAPRSDGRDGDRVDVLGMSVLAQGGETGDLEMRLAFDPLNPLLAARTRLGFFDDGGGGAAGPLAARLRTSRGYATRLQPLAAAKPLRPARLVLCRTPLAVSGEETAAVPLSYHLAPDGAFALTVVPPAAAAPETVDRHRLMLGLSGLEYAALDPGAGPEAIVLFAAGQPAFAPAAAPQAPASPPGAKTLTAAATTAHLAVLPPASGSAGLVYFAQPRQAPLYAGGGDLGPGVLRFLEVAAKTLPGWTEGEPEPPPTYPAAALAGTAPADAALARRIEQAALAPGRRLGIGIPAADPTLLDESTPAVTPQGLMMEVSASEIERIVIANMPGTPQGRLGFAPVGDRLRAAVQANELFFVVGDPEKLMEDSSIPFRLDAAGLALVATGLKPAVLAALRAIVPFQSADREAFRARLPAAADAGEREALEAVAGYLKALIGGWTFQLSPPAWRRGEAPTMMLFKFCNRSLAELVEDGAAWGWEEAAGPGTAQDLREFVAAAKRRADAADVPRDDPYVRFYEDVVAEPGWNGVLFLNAPVALAELPSELQFVAAGIDPDRFYAHHVGFAATPVEVAGGAIAIKQSAAFGLIDYQDPVDLTLGADNRNPDFGFKTLALTARFANAALVDFSARLELMVNALFGAPLTKADPSHGNNLLLTGSTQRHGEALSYAFVLEGEHVYMTDRTVLETVQVDTVKVLSTAAAGASGEVDTSFLLGGWLRFAGFPEFDPFCFGGAPGDPPVEGRLRFDGLRVEMSFPLASPRQQSFACAIDGVRLDPANSTPRPRALISRFPVTLAGLVGSTTQRPEETGFASVSAPLDQEPLSPPWYGLEYELDLGTLGALAGATGLSLKLLAAWGAAAEAGARPAFVGLQLPVGMHWTLQSVIDLGFRSFEFKTFEEEGGGLAYVLRLRRFALTLLGISLPPGNLDLTLFGDPDDPSSRVVGWYAAYEDESAKKLGRESGVGA